MKNKKVLALVLAATLAMAPATAMAAEWQGPNGNGVDGDVAHEGDAAEYGHTTFSIIEAKQNPNNVSFEVPLYVTMAAVNLKADLMVPTNYDIYNTSGKLDTDGGVNELEDVDGVSQGFDIAVVGMDFTKLADAKYSTVETAAGSATDLQLTIGGIVMPAIAATTTDEVTVKVDVTATDNAFYSVTGKKFAKISVGVDAEYDNPAAVNKINIPIIGTLGTAPTGLENLGAAAQFKVQYTVGALDENGDLMGSVYAGDNKVLAGLVKASNE